MISIMVKEKINIEWRTCRSEILGMDIIWFYAKSKDGKTETHAEHRFTD
jgi:hypothetical protein